ncbi:hypothetical protein BDQ12DRAFT_650069 [Crucibulum laeve]|uniref:CBM1 domain-containing protein n=1 Tax=Crucibulum laeve TaxID=68775 RepID=A0A5C3M2D7_9AGAR|nr:hypothetical protein BDQ12DRAFT_650069 [Crucibulum laeve]
MHWRSLLSVVLVTPFSHALIRFPCSQLVTERFDPLVTPGIVSPHLHQIIGANAFNLSIPSAYDPATASCTTCRFKEDKSNYWTAVLYFKHPNGTFMRVPQMANQYVGSPNGGMTVYYIQPPNGAKVTSFPRGFRMISGDPFIRNNTWIPPNTAVSRALTFRCFSDNFGNNNGSPGAGTDTVNLPKQKCTGGIRSNIYFPSCWDGVTLDPPDHHSHVAYPEGPLPSDGSLFFNANPCPSSHPVRLPMIFMETVWDTRQFNMWPTDGSQPFVYSMGDPTGYGQHADYVFGWEGDSLQRAMDTCTDISGVPDSCKALTVQTDAQINSCKQAVQVNEVTEGQYLPRLPGCNPVQPGPARATMFSTCDAVSTTGGVPSSTATAAPPPTTSMPSSAQAAHYAQCGGKNYNGPTSCQAPYTCKYSNDYYSQCL